MKTALKISIILNLGLLGSLVFIWANQRRAGVMSALPVETRAGPPVQAIAASAPPVVRQTEPAPFNWSQLESSDYRTYIKNLRDIGCPEATLRVIVTADMNVLYQKRSQELEQKLVDIDNSSWSVQFSSLNLQQALRAELQKLPGEEVAEIADLLGWQPAVSQEVALNTVPSPPTGTAALSQEGTTPSSQGATIPSSEMDTTSSSQVSNRRNGSQNTHVLMPLVFQKVDPSVLKLDKQQIQAVNDLRQSFVDEIGGLNQNPQDPAYLQRWQTAQPENDNLMQGMLGIMAWETYQVETWNGP
jgi:hypothetical protein